MSHEEKKQNFKFGWPFNIILILAIILLLFSVIAPYLFTQYSIIDFTENGEIGDAIGGITAPFIAVAGIGLTFIAFLVQYQANTQQRQQFQEQIAEDKKQFQLELSEQRESARLAQFENQFYEMLRLHKENVNELTISQSEEFYTGKEISKQHIQITGRAVFSSFLDELRIINAFAEKQAYLPTEDKSYFNHIYGVFFNGIHDLNRYEQNKLFTSIIKPLAEFRDSILSSQSSIRRTVISNFCNLTSIKNIHNSFVKGQSPVLGHYYRHLYQTVKFVANQPLDFLTYEEKRKYLRVLRAQLSNPEQALLFYNWYADFGKKWENDENKFFTDYRMIHNLFQDLLIPRLDLLQIFKLDQEPYYAMEQGRQDDFLFEFQDWW